MHSETRKTLGSSAFYVATLLLVYLLWERSVVLSVLLAGTSFVMLCIERSRAAFYIYVTAFLCGPLSEMLIIYSGAWTYTHPHILGVPVWLSFVWGNAGLFFYRMTLMLRHVLEKDHSSD